MMKPVMYPVPEDMERVEKIRKHPEFQKAMKMVALFEKDRIFCRHSMNHLLDVARIAQLDNLENHRGYLKDVTYGAGLLHDVGKYLQYSEGIGHHIASVQLARLILKDAGYEPEEIELICQAILGHRDGTEGPKDEFSQMLYRADKISRSCYDCPASAECNWSDEKKTTGVIA